MVRLPPKVGIHQLVTLRLSGVAVGGLQCHEHRVDLIQDGRVVGLENPTFLRRIIRIKYSQTTSRLTWTFPFSPNPIVIGGILEARIGHVVCAKQQRFPFSKEDSSKRWPSLPF